MAFDKSCGTYWCDNCGKMMDVDYENCNDYGLVLKCAGTTPCGHRKFFVRTDEECFVEATRE